MENLASSNACFWIRYWISAFKRIAVGGLSLMFQILRDVHEMFGLVQPSLRGRVFALRHNQGVIVLRDGHGQTAARNFSLCVGQSFRCFGARKSRSHQDARARGPDAGSPNPDKRGFRRCVTNLPSET